MTPPTVVISLDLELSWGSFDISRDNRLGEMARWTNQVGAPRLLNHLVANGLSATWAVVGAMMRRSLPDVSGLPEVSYAHFRRPWFSQVPKDGDALRQPEWFGAELVELIRSARPEQEIGFHSFSHAPFGWPGMTRERAISEYEFCNDVASDLGLSARSFVFPRNSIAYLSELRQAGFACYRDVDELPWRFANKKLNSLAMALADFLGLAPCVVEPKWKNGMVAIPGSLMVRYAEGWRKYIPDSSRLRRLEKGLRKVKKSGGVFHVWFHPENLYAERPRLEHVIARFLEEVGRSVRQGELRCLTMGQLAAEFQEKLSTARTRDDAQDLAPDSVPPVTANQMS
jgi:hypothetical protein